jgi:hypothetical protein
VECCPVIFAIVAVHGGVAMEAEDFFDAVDVARFGRLDEGSVFSEELTETTRVAFGGAGAEERAGSAEDRGGSVGGVAGAGARSETGAGF